jgi:Plant Basic Secretory Protein.
MKVKKQKVQNVEIEFDSSEAPVLTEWCNTLKQLIQTWYPKIYSILEKDEPPTLRRIFIETKRMADDFPACTSENKIFINPNCFEKNPHDLGAIIHELVHVVQSYPSKEPSWVTEGIADYIRYVFYENKTLDFFPTTDSSRGYTIGYDFTAGFFLWLENYISQGIIKKLNKSMKTKTFTPKLFEEETGKTLHSLWEVYLRNRDGSEVGMSIKL